MINLAVYLNDDILDLYQDTKFQMTVNGFDALNPIKRSASYTSSIRIPPTKRNLNIAKIYDSKTESDVPYSKLKIKIVEDGIEIFKGNCFISRRRGGITISGITEEADVFDRLKNIFCSQIYDTIKGGDPPPGEWLYKPYGHKKLDSATYYTQRNGLNNIYAPLMDYGKQDVVPDTLVENYSFTTVQAPWTVETLPLVASTIGWTYTGGVSMVSAIMALNAVSLAVVNREVRLYAGFVYNITFELSLSVAVSTNVFIFGITDKDEVVQFGSPTNYTTTGTKYPTQEVTTTVNYKAIGIYITRPSGAGNQVVTLQNAALSDVTFVKIQEPYYLPVYSWIEAIKKGIAKVFNGTFSYNENFTAAQTALVESCVIQSIRNGMEYPKWYLDERNLIQEASGSQVIGLGNNVVKFPNRIKGSYGWWLDAGDFDGGGITYGDEYLNYPDLVTGDDASSGFYADFICDMVVNITTMTGASPQAWFELEIESGKFFRSPVFNSTGRKQFTMSSRGLVVDSAGAATPPYAYPKGLRIGSTDHIIDVHSRTGGTISYSVTVEYARLTVQPVKYPQDEAVLMPSFILPDFTVYDLLKDYLIRTCSLINLRNSDGSLRIASIESIINNKSNAVDWTEKRVKEDDDITFEVSRYAKNNIYTDKEGIQNEFSNMNIEVENENISEEKTAFESKFDSITDSPVKSAPAASIGAFDQDSELLYKQAVEWTVIGGIDAVLTTREYKFDGINAKTSLLKLRDSTTSDPVVKYGTTTAATFKVASYAKWSEFKELFYSSFQEAVRRTKVIGRRYNLNRNDINALDVFTLVYDDGQYFLIVSLKYSPGQTSDVTLFRVF
jgi:hypothetical protein